MIRPATIKDTPALCNLLEQLGYATTEQQIQLALVNSSDANQVYVYEQEGTVIGCIAIARFFYFPTQQTILRVTALCVDQHYRGRRIGQALLRFVEDLALTRSSIVEVTCSLQRLESHQFYFSQEYIQQGYRFMKQFD